MHWLSRFIEGHDPERLRRGLVWLGGFVWPRRRAIAGLLGLALLASALGLLQPWLVKLLIDNGLLAGDYRTLVLIAATMIAVSLAGTLLGGLNRYLHTRLSGQILFALREDLYAHLQALSPGFYARRRTGDILSRLDGDVAEIQRFALDSLFATVSNLLGLLGAVLLMVLLSWQLALLAALLIPVEILYLRVMRRRVERDTRRLRERSADLSSFLVETLPAMKFIQSVAAERRESARLHGLGERYLGDLLRLQITQFLTSAVPGALTSLSRAGAFLIGGYWVIEGSWQLGSLIAFSTYLGMASGPVQGLLGLYVAVQRMAVSLERVAELRQARAEVHPPARPRRLAEPVRGEIVLEQVSFRYPDRPEQPLDAVDLRLPAGACIALTGASGVGKSTLIDLLLRHYDPQRGRIRFDGIDLRELDPAELRRRIAVVSQDLVLFGGSLADNIAYADPSVDRARLMAAVEQARLGELVADLPQGLDTPLGERGVQLSGGQRQRVAIARALVRDPAVLILDEATSAIDEATEAQVIDTVDALFADRTRLLISHRAATLRRATLRLRLHEGKLCEIRDPAAG